jgi:hypothetical protein
VCRNGRIAKPTFQQACRGLCVPIRNEPSVLATEGPDSWICGTAQFRESLGAGCHNIFTGSKRRGSGSKEPRCVSCAIPTRKQENEARRSIVRDRVGLDLFRRLGSGLWRMDSTSPRQNLETLVRRVSALSSQEYGWLIFIGNRCSYQRKRCA